MRSSTKKAPSRDLWNELGITVARWADSTFLYGVGELSINVTKKIMEQLHLRRPPLNWVYPWIEKYNSQNDVLWVLDESQEQTFLPQVLIVGPSDVEQEKSIHLCLHEEDFKAPYKAQQALEFYRRDAANGERKIFFDGENARLTNWRPSDCTMEFQGCSFFDYLQTNLALDTPIPAISSIREYTARQGVIEPLNNSILANSSGINGLIFSNDGYIIIQRRGDNVLIRPRELCPGFSGTIDKQDIIHAIARGGTLDKLDTPREMVEEVGIQRKEIRELRFFGLTRELVRGGTPEFFYSLDTELSSEEICSRTHRDNEGEIQSVYAGPFALTNLAEREKALLPQYFWTLVRDIQKAGKGSMSIPLLTNLVLWYKLACPQKVGINQVPSKNSEGNSI